MKGDIEPAVMDLNFSNELELPVELASLGPLPELDLNTLESVENNGWLQPCQECARLKKEIEKMKKEHTLDFDILKQKMESTDMLIKKFKEKSKEVETQNKKIKEMKKQVEKANREAQTIQLQLQRTLLEVEPLKKSKALLERQKVVSEGQIENLNDKLHAAEAVVQQYKDSQENLEMKLNEATSNKKQTAKEIHSLKTSQKKHDALVKKLQDECRQKKTELIEQRKEITALKKKLERAEVQIEKKTTITPPRGQTSRQLLCQEIYKRAHQKSNPSNSPPSVTENDSSANKSTSRQPSPVKSSPEVRKMKMLRRTSVTDLLSDFGYPDSELGFLGDLLSPSLRPLSPLPESPFDVQKDGNESESSCSGHSDGEDDDIDDFADLLESQLQNVSISPDKSQKSGEGETRGEPIASLGISALVPPSAGDTIRSPPRPRRVAELNPKIKSCPFARKTRIQHAQQQPVPKSQTDAVPPEPHETSALTEPEPRATTLINLSGAVVQNLSDSDEAEDEQNSDVQLPFQSFASSAASSAWAGFNKKKAGKNKKRTAKSSLLRRGSEPFLLSSFKENVVKDKVSLSSDSEPEETAEKIVHDKESSEEKCSVDNKTKSNDASLLCNSSVSESNTGVVDSDRVKDCCHHDGNYSHGTTRTENILHSETLKEDITMDSEKSSDTNVQYTASHKEGEFSPVSKSTKIDTMKSHDHSVTVKFSVSESENEHSEHDNKQTNRKDTPSNRVSVRATRRRTRSMSSLTVGSATPVRKNSGSHFLNRSFSVPDKDNGNSLSSGDDDFSSPFKSLNKKRRYKISPRKRVICSSDDENNVSSLIITRKCLRSHTSPQKLTLLDISKIKSGNDSKSELSDNEMLDHLKTKDNKCGDVTDEDNRLGSLHLSPSTDNCCSSSEDLNDPSDNKSVQPVNNTEQNSDVDHQKISVDCLTNKCHLETTNGTIETEKVITADATKMSGLELKENIDQHLKQTNCADISTHCLNNNLDKYDRSELKTRNDCSEIESLDVSAGVTPKNISTYTSKESSQHDAHSNIVSQDCLNNSLRDSIIPQSSFSKTESKDVRNMEKNTDLVSNSDIVIPSQDKSCISELVDSEKNGQRSPKMGLCNLSENERKVCHVDLPSNNQDHAYSLTRDFSEKMPEKLDVSQNNSGINHPYPVVETNENVSSNCVTDYKISDSPLLPNSTNVDTPAVSGSKHVPQFENIKNEVSFPALDAPSETKHFSSVSKPELPTVSIFPQKLVYIPTAEDGTSAFSGLPAIIRASQSAITVVSPEMSGMPAVTLGSSGSTCSTSSPTLSLSSSTDLSAMLSPVSSLPPSLFEEQSRDTILSSLPPSPIMDSDSLEPLSPLSLSPLREICEPISPLPPSPVRMSPSGLSISSGEMAPLSPLQLTPTQSRQNMAPKLFHDKAPKCALFVHPKLPSAAVKKNISVDLEPNSETTRVHQRTRVPSGKRKRRSAETSTNRQSGVDLVMNDLNKEKLSPKGAALQILKGSVDPASVQTSTAAAVGFSNGSKDAEVNKEQQPKRKARNPSGRKRKSPTAEEPNTAPKKQAIEKKEEPVLSIRARVVHVKNADREIGSLLKQSGVKARDVADRLTNPANPVPVAIIVERIIKVLLNMDCDLLLHMYTECASSKPITKPFFSEAEGHLMELINLLLTKPNMGSMAENLKTALSNAINKKDGVWILAKLSLTRMLTGVCRHTGDAYCVRSMLYDALYKQWPGCHSIVLAAAGVWPQIFMTSGDFCGLLRVMEYAVHKKICLHHSTSHKVKTCLEKLCECKGFTLNSKQLTSQLLVDLQKASSQQANAVLFETSKAIQLLSVTEGWTWTNNSLIRETIWPCLHQWGSGQGHLSETFITTILDVIGQVCCLCPAANASSVQEIMKTLSALLHASHQSSISPQIQMSVIGSLIRLSPFNPHLVATAIHRYNADSNDNRTSTETNQMIDMFWRMFKDKLPYV